MQEGVLLWHLQVYLKSHSTKEETTTSGPFPEFSLSELMLQKKDNWTDICNIALPSILVLFNIPKRITYNPLYVLWTQWTLSQNIVHFSKPTEFPWKSFTISQKTAYILFCTPPLWKRVYKLQNCVGLNRELHFAIASMHLTNLYIFSPI